MHAQHAESRCADAKEEDRKADIETGHSEILYGGWGTICSVIKRTTRTTFLISKPLTTVNMSPPEQPPPGKYIITSLAEIKGPAGINLTPLPFQTAYLDAPDEIVG